MNRLLTSIALAAVFAGCATSPEIPKTPEPVQAVEAARLQAAAVPNPFSDYGAAMASNAKLPMAVEWHNRNAAVLARETDVGALKKIATDRKAADGLLAQVKGAYESDAMVLTRIAAVSQIVMCPKWSEAPAARSAWTEALLGAAEKATDDYRKLFFLDQLRWCGKANQQGRVLDIGRKSGSRSVADFAMMVASELK